MGLINFGVPEREAEYLKNSLKLDVFVEGGTYKGGTAKSMSNKFKKVYTIEKSDVMYDIAKENLKNISNVSMLKGDTREHLSGILENNDNILFWLDSHWSGGDTYGEEDECPLLEELEIIFQYHKNFVILIDDARLFLAPPPLPHKFKNWQTITDIVQVMPDDWNILEYEDVIYLFSEKGSDEFKSFLQGIITEKATHSKGAFLRRLFNR
jgi:hypothetical protein